MSSFATIPPVSYSSSFSNASYHHQPSRVCFVSRNNPRSNFENRRIRLSGEVRRTTLKCNCSSKGQGGSAGENGNRNVLDAFFLGKALAEVINERIESTVGEVLGNIGRFQAEQQKQVQEIQEEVLERAKRAKERAARETTMVVAQQGLTNPSKPAAAPIVVASVTPTSIVETKAISNDEKLSVGDIMDDDSSSSSSDDEENDV